MKEQRGVFSAEVTSAPPNPPIIVVIQAPREDWKKVLNYLGESNGEQMTYDMYAVLRDALAPYGVTE